jgi:predicted DNA-binding transcriptional regulator YafY
MSNPRARLLQTRAYLLEHTDERHPATLAEIAAALEREGIEADARALLADLEALRASGLDVCSTRGRSAAYYVGQRLFPRVELRLLMDMVRASRFLSKGQANALLDKLSGLSGEHERGSLRLGATRPDSPTPEQTDAFQTVDRILAALEAKKQLSFVYCSSTGKDTVEPRRGGQAYVVNPCLLLYAEENYYLVADHPLHEGLAHYRLDRMRDPTLLERDAAPQDMSFDPAAYARSVFSMYPAKQRWVRLAFDRALTGAMLDRFGANVPLELLDERTGSLYAPVCAGRPFFGWVFSFCGGVRILAPDDLREQMLLMLEAGRVALGERYF